MPVTVHFNNSGDTILISIPRPPHLWLWTTLLRGQFAFHSPFGLGNPLRRSEWTSCAHPCLYLGHRRRFIHRLNAEFEVGSPVAHMFAKGSNIRQQIIGEFRGQYTYFP